LDVNQLLRQTLPPEFLNRIDENIMFSPLTKKEVKQIVTIQFQSVVDKMQKQGVALTASEEALEWMAEMGYDPQFGARPIKRVIQKSVLNELSKLLLAGKVEKNTQLVLDVFDNQFVVRKPIKEIERLFPIEEN
jgi:ATP-dependent Clp protease ATP-binding subunit ClpB